MNGSAYGLSRSRVSAIVASSCILLAVLALMCMVLPAGKALASQDALVAAQVSEVGTTFSIDGNTYKVTEAYESARDIGEVMLVRYGSSSKAATFDTVKHDGKVYEVEAIGKGAFNNAKGHKITSVTLGRHVGELKAKAFYGCSKLRVIDIAKSDVIDIARSKRDGSYYIDDVDMGKNAFGKAGANGVKVRCGSADADYQALVKKALVAKGLNKSAVVVK